MLQLSILWLSGVYVSSIVAKELQATSSTLQRSTAQVTQAESKGVSKRDLKPADFSSLGTVGIAAKNYDPPPEFYRGPGSTGHQLTTTQVPSYHSNFKPYNGFKSRPVAFPDASSTSTSNNYNNYNKYQASGESGGGGGGPQTDTSDLHAANSYKSWQHLHGKVGSPPDKNNDALQDRISVGQYTNSEHGSSASGAYAYEGRPYAGQSQHAEYASHYGGVVPGSAHAAGYYGASATAAEGVPFDVYGGKNQYPYSDGPELAAHKSHPDLSHKALLAKSFLIPLASAAVLGIAAALVSNPLLLQLGTFSGVAPAAVAYGKRKRRDLTTAATPNANHLQLTLTAVDKNKKDSKLFPYRGHHHRRDVRA